MIYRDLIIENSAVNMGQKDASGMCEACVMCSTRHGVAGGTEGNSDRIFRQRWGASKDAQRCPLGRITVSSVEMHDFWGPCHCMASETTRLLLG